MVFVLNANKQPLNPCRPAKARRLLTEGKAVVHKQIPFTIRLKEKKEMYQPQTYRVKIDPGSKITGLSILKGNKVIFLAELHHQTTIKSKLEKRSSYRRNRRSRKTRYRQARFLNRSRKEGWIPPSLQARVDTISSWVKRLKKLVPVSAISMELVRFDTQKMQNAEISGIEYQQGTLEGYEIREYLLEKFGRACVYCEQEHIPLEVEHVHCKARGGSNRVSNLTIACHRCNQEKGKLLLSEWMEQLGRKKDHRSKTILTNIPKVIRQLKMPLKDAAVMNITRWKLYQTLEKTGLALEVGTGARTKMQRIQHGLPKEHYYDAVCVGESTPSEPFRIETDMVFQLKSKGRGSRYRSRTDKYGFPIRSMPKTKYIQGFISGDMVKAVVPKGKYKGTWFGQIAMRSSGYVDIKDFQGNKLAQGVGSKYCQIVQRFDGYAYGLQERATAIPPHA